jgi:HlyD family secretion protein
VSEKKLFRDKALQNLSSPEQLDMAVTLIPSAGWLGLLSLGLLTIVIVLWGFMGSLSYPQYGTGVLIRGERIHGIYSRGAGTVAAMNVTVGDYVEYGQIIGRIDMPQVINDIAELKNKIKILQKEYEDVRELDEKYLGLIAKYYDSQTASSKKQEEELKQISYWYEKFLTNAEEVKKQGIISDYSLHQHKKDYTSVMNNLSDMRNNQLNYDAQKQNTDFNQRKDHFSRMENITQQIYNAQLKVDALISQSMIISYSSGYVQEVLSFQGDMIKENERVANLAEKNDQPLKAVLYFSTVDGKAISYGMEAQITPTFLQAEDFGAIKGLVMSTSPYPTSQEEINETFLNQSLTNAVLNVAGGSPYKIEIGLQTSPDTASGFQWTTSKGPSFAIKEGTLVSGAIITRSEKPINLVVQMFRRYFLGVGQREFELKQKIK